MKLNTKSLSDVVLGTPLLEETFYSCALGKPEVVSNKAGDGNILKLTLRVLDPVVKKYDTGESVANPSGNMVLWDNVSLTPTDKYDPDKRLKELGLALYGEDDCPDDLELEHLQEGLTLVVKLRHEPSKDSYPAKNIVARYYHESEVEVPEKE